MRAIRWLFYAINGEALGHLTRLLGLARQLRKRSPESEFLFLTSNEAVTLAWQEGFASLKVPSHASVKMANLRFQTYLRLLHTVVPSVAACYDPEIMVVDTSPGGSVNELLPILQWSLRRVLIYREQKSDTVEAPNFQKRFHRYHRVIVPHDAGTGGDSMAPQPQAEYVGHMLLRSSTEGFGRDEARDRLGLPREGTLVYVGFGGGGDPVYSSVVEWVLKQAADFPAFHFACALPPLGQADWTAMQTMQMPNVSWFRYWPLAECWSAFDGAVSAVGYNTAGELLHHGVPTIWIPIEKRLDDQQLRAERAVARGAGWLVRQNDTGALRAALGELADPAKRHAVAGCNRQMVPVNGAERAAESLLSWIGN